jgi:transposase
MGYSGAVSSEDSSGERVRRGVTTKTANAHLRRIVMEAAKRLLGKRSIGYMRGIGS